MRLLARFDAWLDRVGREDGDDLAVHEQGLVAVGVPACEPHDELLCDPYCEDWGYPCQAP